MLVVRCFARTGRGVRLARLLWAGLLVVIGIGAGARMVHAENFHLEGKTERPAWSGWWWPVLTTQGPHLYDTTGPTTPLLKYGQLTGDMTPLKWEQTYEMSSDPQATWFGHCNGWAAASLMEDGPLRPLTTPQGITFTVGEIKGLLTASHQFDPAEYFRGARHDMGADSNTDLRALDFHKAVLFYIGSRREGLIFNLSNLPQVWSYPADSFVMDGTTDPTFADVTHITAKLGFADDGVQPDYVGSKRINKSFTYWVKGDPQSVSGVTDAGWEGNSRSDHPQFVWNPAYARAYWPGVQTPNTLHLPLVQLLAQVSAGTYVPH